MAGLSTGVDPMAVTFLEQVEAIRRFAVDNLELVDSDNYTTYVRTDQDFLVTVVSAAGALSFERRTWWFPFFGRFPYKGFYREEGALRLARRLKRQGYDVFLRRADAFSTLGYFRDPLYSFMSEYDTFRLASLIIHEQTHATFFLKNHVQFNEELATFVGHKGALAYLSKLYGSDSAEYREALVYWEELDAFLAEVRSLHLRLSKLYDSTPPEEPQDSAEPQDSEEPRDRANLLALKASTIRTFQNQYAARYDATFTTDRFRWFADYPLNNAVIDAYMNYTQDLSLFEMLYDQVGSSIPRMLSALEPLSQYRGDPKDYLRRHILSDGRTFLDEPRQSCSNWAHSRSPSIGHIKETVCKI